MLDGMISTMSSNYMGYLGSGIVPNPMGTSFPTVVPYCAFHTLDRDISIAVGSEKAMVGELPDYRTAGSRTASGLLDQRPANP